MKKLFSILSVCLCASSCIVNDVPYPVVKAAITELKTPDGTVSIDSENRIVTIDLFEASDPKKVTISEVKYNSSLVKASKELVGVQDLTNPIQLTLHTYQDYLWTVAGTQTIERYFTMKSQVGAATIDAKNRRVVVQVSKKQPLSSITVLSMKLGPADISTYSPTIDQLRDFSEPVSVRVSFRDVVEDWTIFASQTDVSVKIESLDVWTRCAWLSASGIEGEKCGFKYRKEGETDWMEASGVVVSGGNFSAMIDELEPKTKYEFAAYCGSEMTAVENGTTGEEQQLPNAGLEVYSHAESQNYFSFYDTSRGVSKWWDSGNKGSTTIGEMYSICMPDTEIYKVGAASAHLVSRYVVVKFAAGNIFCGEFAGLVGTSGGMVNFGHPFTQRPRALRFWAMYKCGKVDCIGSYPEGEVVKTGDPDRANVFIALGDWDYRKYGGTPESPVQVNTTNKATYFNPNSEGVIAFGQYITDKTTDGWELIEIPLEYRSVSRVPSHIIVSCAASMLGDYFTGSSSSELWLDDFQLVY